MTRGIGVGLVLTALAGSAPFQCGKSNPDGALRKEDSPGDALYKLAMDFRAKGDEAAARQTLRFLVQHYPSNRHAGAARAELEGAGDAGP